MANGSTSTKGMKSLGMWHFDHPLLGHQVIDHAHDDAVGVLRAFAPAVDTVTLVPSVPKGDPVAWLAPLHGGVEWTTHPDEIEAA